MATTKRVPHQNKASEVCSTNQPKLTFTAAGDELLANATETRMDRVESLGESLVFPNQDAILPSTVSR